MKKLIVAIALLAGFAVAAHAAVNLTINGVRTSQIVITIEYNTAGLATGAQVSAHGQKLDSTGAEVLGLEKAWDYATLPAVNKTAIRALVQATTKAMSQEVNETAEVVLP